MKKLLFLSPFFFPEVISTGKYNTHLVTALGKKGFSINVITSYPLYPDWEPKFTEATLEGINIHRGGLEIRYPTSQVLKRIVLELWFAFYVVKSIYKLRKEVDVLIVIFPPVFFMLFAHIILPKHVSRIGIVHDLLGVMATSAKKKSRKLIAKLIGVVESIALAKCDKVICLSESMQKFIIEKYGILEKKCSVHYPFVSTEHEVSKTDQLSEIFDDGYQHIVYSGALGEKQKPNAVYDFFQLLSESRKGLKCHIFSRGPIFSQLRKQAPPGSVCRVYFHDLVPAELLPELFDRSTVHVIPQAEGTSAGAFPSKLPNLIAFGVPVFAICDNDSELAKVVTKMKYSRTNDTWDKTILVNQMKSFLTEIDGVSHEDIKETYMKSLLMKFSVDDLVKNLVQDL